MSEWEPERRALAARRTDELRRVHLVDTPKQLV